MTFLLIIRLILIDIKVEILFGCRWSGKVKCLSNVWCSLGLSILSVPVSLYFLKTRIESYLTVNIKLPNRISFCTMNPTKNPHR